VDDGIHAPDRVDLFCDAPRLGTALEVPDHNAFRSRRQHSERCGAIGRPRVEHHPVTLIEERLRRCAAKTVRTTRDENERHLLSFTCPSYPRPDLIAPNSEHIIPVHGKCMADDVFLEVRENDGCTRAGETPVPWSVPFQMPPL
jgi:hypothetical protein